MSYIKASHTLVRLGSAALEDAVALPHVITKASHTLVRLGSAALEDAVALPHDITKASHALVGLGSAAPAAAVYSLTQLMADGKLVGDLFWPSDVEDVSEAIVDKGLQLAGVGLSHSPYF